MHFLFNVRLAAALCLVLFSTSASASETFAFGPVEKIAKDGSAITVLGQKYSIEGTGRKTSSAEPTSVSLQGLRVGAYVLVDGELFANGELVARSIRLSKSAYVPGASEVFLSGVVSRYDVRVGLLTIGGVQVYVPNAAESSTLSFAVGDVLEIAGYQAQPLGSLWATTILNPRRSAGTGSTPTAAIPANGAALQSIEGTGVRSLKGSIEGTGVQSNEGTGVRSLKGSIEGTGLQSIEGTGVRSLKGSIEGTGLQSIEGTGVRSLKASIEGTGLQSIEGTGVRSLKGSIEGTGVQSIEGTGVRSLKGSIEGTGVQSIEGTGVRSLKGSIEGTGVQSIEGTGVRSLKGSIEGTGVQSIEGTGIRSLKGSIEGTGVQSIEGTGVRSLKGSIEGTGIQSIEGTGIVAL